MLTKKFLVNSFISIATTGFLLTAQAATPGFYVGIQGGYSDTHFSQGDISMTGTGLSTSIKDHGLASRAFAGYQFNENWAGELGYTRFNDTRLNNIKDKEGHSYPNGSLKEHALDLVAKGTWPLADQFNIYAKLGVAAIEAYGADTVTNDFGTKINPTFGAGISYELNRQVPIDISWTRIQKWGGNIPNADFFAIGIAYKFS